jgi:hypothetical protein
MMTRALPPPLCASHAPDLFILFFYLFLTFLPFVIIRSKMDGTDISTSSRYQLQNQLYYYMSASNISSTALQQM